MRIAAQVYTIRQAFSDDPSAALGRLRDAGYDRVELAGLADRGAEEILRALTSNGVEAMSMHVALERLQQQQPTVIAEAHALAVGEVVVPWLDSSYRRDGLDGYRRAGRELAALADDLGAEGLALVYHNHDFEFGSIDGQTPLDVLLDAAGPEIGLELDLGWVRAAAADPTAWLHRAAGRVKLAHFKDVRIGPGGEAASVPLGEGLIDWAEVIAASREIGLAWAIVEDDDALDPFDSLARSRTYLESLLT